MLEEYWFDLYEFYKKKSFEQSQFYGQLKLVTP